MAAHICKAKNPRKISLVKKLK